MNFRTKLQSFSQDRLALVLGIYILLQPVLDALTAFGAAAGHSVTAGIVVRTLFLVLTFLYVLLISRFPGKRLCLIYMGVLLGYLILFMLYMLSVGGVSLCLRNVQDVVKTFFAPFVLAFLYAVYRQYGCQISARALAWAGGIYAGIILLAYLTDTSFVSYGNSGYGYSGWFYAANEISCIISLTAPVTIWYCVKQLPTVTRNTWWKGVLIAAALISVAFSATAIGTKIVFAATLLYTLLAAVWALFRWRRERTRGNLLAAVVLWVMWLFILAMYFRSPLMAYLNNVYIEMWDRDSEMVAISWGKEMQQASQGTWLRELIENNGFVETLDTILSRRLLSSSPSVQVYTEGPLLAKLLGIGYADAAAYSRSVEFMIEIDPLSILVRHGILGFLTYYVPYLVSIVYAVIQFFKRPRLRLSSLKYCSYLYAALVGFAISTIAGHGLVSPAVSTFLLVITFSLWILTREQNRGDLAQ